MLSKQDINIVFQVLENKTDETYVSCYILEQILDVDTVFQWLKRGLLWVLDILYKNDPRF